MKNVIRLKKRIQMLKNKIWVNGILAIVIGLFFTACAGINKANLAKKNRPVLMKIDVGMNKKDIVTLFGDSGVEDMPNPYKREVFTKSNGDILEALFFITEHIPDGITSDTELTPIMLLNKKVIGWGWSFYSKSKNDVEININKYN